MKPESARSRCARKPFLASLLVVSAVALAACTDTDALKNLVQLKELSPDAAVSVAGLPFDAGVPLTIRGRVTTLLFAKPGASGAMVVHTTAGPGKYVFSTAPTPDLARQGFSRFTLKPGEAVIVTGVLAEHGQQIEGLAAARADTIATADGRRVFDRTALPAGRH
ncbi:MAG: hypothetical protein LAP40_03480 [Acidobacteriia bacterium]|nr:hypothetical protein [Terriglobia bacterium]